MCMQQRHCEKGRFARRTTEDWIVQVVEKKLSTTTQKKFVRFVELNKLVNKWKA